MGKRCHPGLATARELITARLDTLRGLVPSVRARDPDGIHDMRVASRRLRAVLREYRAFLPPKQRKLVQKRTRLITQGLSAARELDVTLQRITELRTEVPVPAHPALDDLVGQLKIERENENAATVRSTEIIESKAFGRAANALIENASVPRTCRVGAAGRRSLRKRMRRLRARYRHWTRSQLDADLHATRVALKTLRYACESYDSLYGDAMLKFINKLKMVQAALGEWNDFRILRDYARKTNAPASPSMNIVCETLQSKVEHLQSEFASTAEDFFSKPSRNHFREVLRSP